MDMSPDPATTATTTSTTTPSRIDRRAVVSRHNVTLNQVDLANPLQVGNGEFAFALDATGMQTLAEAHRATVPINTMAQWAWHSDPNPNGYTLEETERTYDVGGRAVPYADLDADPAGTLSPAAAWLRANPHRMSLARIALVGKDGASIAPADVTNVAQSLDLWTGTVTSTFDCNGQRVEVTTAAHPTRDIVAFRVAAAAGTTFAPGALAIRIGFPAALAGRTQTDDWTKPDAHQTVYHLLAGRTATFERKQDATMYAARAAWTGDVEQLAQAGPHLFDLALSGSATELMVEFAPRPFDMPPLSVGEVLAASSAHWARYWEQGAAIDLGGCDDPRAPELERRIVLSQYLTAINCAGSLPPQETGLMFNSWHGKHHLEMHWWHAAHFAMWGRSAMLERSLTYYGEILPRAQEAAKHQGYAGARWPKMTDLLGRESPSSIGVFLIWQQPHPIYYAELIYRATPTRETLEKYASLVEQTAQFMASYARYDDATKRYVLGPALIPAQESYAAHRATLLNPTFELAYWAWGLTVAQKWRERLGMPPEPNWDDIVGKLAKPTIREGRYAAIETEPFLENDDHPSFLMAMGFLPKTHLIDEVTMRETAKWTKAKWKWNNAWGWDFAALAQTATRLNDPELAVDALSIESFKNTFRANGHNFQSDDLPIYLPGNGGLLAAIALMAGGWDGGPDTVAPGFPKNGRWDVRVEGFGKVI